VLLDLIIETMIAGAVLPIAATGFFDHSRKGRLTVLHGTDFLLMIRRKTEKNQLSVLKTRIPTAQVSRIYPMRWRFNSLWDKLSNGVNADKIEKLVNLWLSHRKFMP
jgi:hypothetical protein